MTVLDRRSLLATAILAPAAARPAMGRTAAHHAAAHRKTHAAHKSYTSFLAGIREEAIAQGLSAAIVTQALALTKTPNARVLKLDRHQPEFTMTWAQYRTRVVGATRISQGKAAWQQRQDLLEQTGRAYGVDPRAIIGIWGLESGFGRKTGSFSVIDSLATLSYDGRRAKFFHGELMKALKILDHGDILPEAMLGSYAGAMGQPQFMPSAYLRFAVDADHDGHRNIWTSEPDVFASVANYLHKSGWQDGAPWGQPVQLTQPIDQARTGRGKTRTLGEWMSLGVRRSDGSRFSRPDEPGALLRPDGDGTEAFMVYHNFNVIRRYNPSDYYALGVGLLGYAIA